MRLALLFSDLHCNNKQLQNMYDFVIQNKEINALVFTGDVVNMGEPVWFMEKFIKVIIELNRPFLWVPGNNDFGRAYFKLNAKYKSLEGRVVELPVIPASPIVIPASPIVIPASPIVIPAKAGIQENTILDPQAPLSSRIAGPEDDKKNSCHPEPACRQAGLYSGSRFFTGVGGSPASWSGQYEGESMIDKKAIAGSIFLSHVPPPANVILKKYDVGAPLAVISTPREDSSGAEKSSNNSKYVKQNTPYEKRRFSDSPLVHICGHLHYRWGTAYLGQTKVIQLASLETGHYAIFDLETLEVKFERF